MSIPDGTHPEGRAKECAETLLRLLVHRFGKVPEKIQARVRDATLYQLNLWADAVLRATTLEEVFEE